MMKTQIKDLRMLVPVVVEFENHSVIVYLDQLKGKVIIPDESKYVMAFDIAEFKEAVLEHMKNSIKPIQTPSVPREGFEKLNPNNYMGEE